MKITVLLVLKCQPEGYDPIILANASDVSHFGFFQRPSIREFIVFVSRTVGKRTSPGQRQSVQHEGSHSLRLIIAGNEWKGKIEKKRGIREMIYSLMIAVVFT
ncbi:VAMP-like protein YKT62 [Hibiscus syriacus]|uniref:VAMP-like protein YKT62 n=1 Tax=Hibiscus syriacus TaxID=106335 RepID=A0A6A2YS29_HIBSY|nr:VAMP-like protein YKT62 [Hibiscus syriacus]